MSSLIAITYLPVARFHEIAPCSARQISVVGVFLSTITATTLRRLVRGSCIDTRFTPRIASVFLRKSVNSGSSATRLMRLDSLGGDREVNGGGVGLRPPGVGVV